MYLRAYFPALVGLCSILAVAGLAQAAPPSTLQVGRFGQVTLYHGDNRQQPLVLFVSGDGGWNLGVVDMAKALAGLGAVVVGIDIVHYLHQLEQTQGECDDVAGDFAELGRVVRQRLQLPQTPLLLVGYSSGATLVYAVLAQALPGTFGGAISMGFCPDLPLRKPLCRGSGLAFTQGPKGKGYSFLPAKTLQQPWIAFQGTIDQVCDAGTVEHYVDQVKGARLVLLPKVGHGFSVQRNWMPQFKDAFNRLQTAPR